MLSSFILFQLASAIFLRFLPLPGLFITLSSYYILLQEWESYLSCLYMAVVNQHN